MRRIRRPSKFDEAALKICPVLFFFQMRRLKPYRRRAPPWSIHARTAAGPEHQSILVLLKGRRSSREIARLVSVAPETVQAVTQLHAELGKHFSGVGQTIGPHHLPLR
jgi:hypothetical protein